MRKLLALFALALLLASSFAVVSPAAANGVVETGDVCFIVSGGGVVNRGGEISAGWLAWYNPLTHALLTPIRYAVTNPGGTHPGWNYSFIASDYPVGMKIQGEIGFNDAPGVVAEPPRAQVAATLDECYSQVGDGRINDGEDQLGAPLAAYCADGGITVWDIAEDGQGTLGFTAALENIHSGLEAAASTGENLLIGEGLGNSLYALPSGQLQFRGPDVREPGKTYDYLTDGAVCG